MKKILITITSIGGGMGRAVINYATELSKLGFDVTIFLLADSRIEQYSLDENIRVIPGITGNYVKYKVFFALFRLRKICLREKFDYVFSFSLKHSAFVIISLLGIKSRVLVFPRANPHTIYSKTNDILNHIFIPKCAGLVVQTQTAKSVYAKKFGHPNIIIVPNPVKEISVNQNQKKEKIVVTVSRIDNGKGLDILVDIFSDICKRGNNEWILQIIGDGVCREKLESQIKSLSMEDRIQILGFQKDVDAFLSKASVFAFASQSEGFPNSLLEAMCSGLPCVSFDCPTGPSEMIVDGENGFLVGLQDKETYINKLQLLMNSQELREKFSTEALKLKDKYNSHLIINNFITELEALNSK